MSIELGDTGVNLILTKYRTSNADADTLVISLNIFVILSLVNQMSWNT